MADKFLTPFNVGSLMGDMSSIAVGNRLRAGETIEEIVLELRRIADKIESCGFSPVLEAAYGARGKAGVYIMASNSVPIYVGQTGNFVSRMIQHLRLTPWINLVDSMITEEISDKRARLDREYQLIRRLQPRFNSVGKNTKF